MGYDTSLTGTFDLDKPLTQEHYDFLMAFADDRHDDTATDKFPGIHCQWVPSGDLLSIEYDGGEKFYNYTEWIEYLIKEFLIPWGYTLNGKVYWSGEDDDDTGFITVTDNDVRTTNIKTYIEELEEGLAKILSLQPTVLPLLMGINGTMDQIVKDLLKGA